MRQIAEHIVQAGHEVTLATTRLAGRTCDVLNGVRIVEFDVAGNRVSGLRGEVERYQRFLATFPADALMIKAAQQWTFDASWDVLDSIRARKIFIPCGFSALYEPAYKDYFKRLPDILRKFDRLVFYAERYRDIDYARAQGLQNISIVPNGASEIEFAVPKDGGFRASLGIPRDDFVILTVGSPISAKGHANVAAAFARLDATSRPMTLILNGDWSTSPSPATGRHAAECHPDTVTEVPGYLRRGFDMWKRQGVITFIKHAAASLYWRAFYRRWRDARAPISLEKMIALAREQPGKTVLKADLARGEIVQAFLTADLFVFASQIEYSPLVLFEAAAAGTPFISAPVGNAEEIARWTGAGVICPATRDRFGYTRVSPRRLAKEMTRLIDDENMRRVLGVRGREAWQSRFNWKSITTRYEDILTGQVNEPTVLRCSELASNSMTPPPNNYRGTTAVQRGS